jgi:hypothetical protein
MTFGELYKKRNIDASMSKIDNAARSTIKLMYSGFFDNVRYKILAVDVPKKKIMDDIHL